MPSPTPIKRYKLSENLYLIKKTWNAKGNKKAIFLKITNKLIIRKFFERKKTNKVVVL